MKRRWVGLGLAASALTLVAPMSATSSGGFQVPADDVASVTAGKAATYIVMMDAVPAVAYEGGEAGLPATAPAEGETIDRSAVAVRRYVGRLTAEQDTALRSAGVPAGAKLATYTYAANGFAVRLTSAQADALAAQPGVAIVVPDQIRRIQTDASPDFLGLTAKKGPWARGLTGEGVVVGVIDTGIWPEHPSFADDGTYPPLPAGEFTGTACDFGNQAYNPADAPFSCNNKLLSAQAFGNVFHGGTGDGLAAGSYLSARDEDGHGTHTSSTAAGNANVSATLLGVDRGTVSGIAPRARIAMYKACWATAPGEGGCSNGDLVDAIDTAVADGVDVINYSIGSDTPGLSPDSISFLIANAFGVYVAASAGNAGPGEGTVGSPAGSPWLTTVGASTQRRDFRGTVTLGDAQVFEGVTVTAGLPATEIVDAAALGNPACLIGGFPDGSVTGKAVLCARGVNARVEKTLAVMQAGGVGVVIFNPTLNTLNTDNHYLPALHVDAAAGAAIAAHIAAGGATVELSGGQKVDAQANVMAAFSSRGPNGFAADIITPDVTAPGVNILAGNTPTALLGAPGQMYQAISGTSMSSPHVAGLYALLKQAHPDWSPAAAKSALMTSAYQKVTKEDGVTPADPFDMGAGHVRPGGDIRKKGSLFNPGLVYDAGLGEYLGFLCEAAPEAFNDPAGTCAALAADGIPTTAENLNLASIAVSDVTGTATVTRTITNVSGKRIKWEADVDAPAGFKIKVSPKKIRLNPGESASFTLTITRTTAAFDTWAFGELEWEGSDYEVRSPIALQAKELAAPAEVSATGTDGSVDLSVGFGYSGTYTAGAHGVVAADVIANTVADDPANDINTALATGVGINVEAVVVPEGTAATRISLFDADMAPVGHDLDLYVFDGDFNFVGGSGSGTSEEQVDLVLPAGGTYFVIVHGWEAVGGSADYLLHTWNVPLAAGTGPLAITAAPATATSGTSGVVTATWSGLTAGTRYMGAVSHSNDAALLALTVVRVNA